jgi:membrane protease subunit HflC
VQTKVFDRMVSERQRVAEAFRSQGQGQSAEILGKKERELKTIRSEAYRQAQEIRGRADAEAAAIYAEAYKADPEFYKFVKTLESYETTVDENTWLLLSTDADYARQLTTMKGN